MPTPYALEAIIAAVAPRLDPVLISRDNLNTILAISYSLPLWRCAGFECRLGTPEPHADFGVHLRREDWIATESVVVANAKPVNAASGDVWWRLHRFAEVWAETECLVSQAVPAMSLEFDLHRQPAPLAAPSIFFSIHPGPCGPQTSASHKAVNTCSKVVRALLEVLAVNVLDDVQHKLEDCLKTLLPKVSFLQFGIWLARPADTFRICAPGISLLEIKPVLNALQWQGPTDAYETCWCDLLHFTDKGSLHLDIGKGVSAKLGIEVPFDDDSAYMKKDNPESTRFLDYLVEKNLCLPEKRDAVLFWVGGFRLSSKSAASSTKVDPIFLRRVSHVKMVYEPDQAPKAKVYLSIGQVPDQT
jgi:hypothetical protein